MTSFDKGDYKGFFDIWDQVVPFQLLSQVWIIIDQSNIKQKLEFYIQIYFGIFPIHPALAQKNTTNITLEASMDRFRKYLETKGNSLTSISKLTYKDLN
jgi:hypothetical protein